MLDGMVQHINQRVDNAIAVFNDRMNMIFGALGDALGATARGVGEGLSSGSSSSASVSSPSAGGFFSGLKDKFNFGDKSPELALAPAKERAVEIAAPSGPTSKENDIHMSRLGDLCAPTFSCAPVASQGTQRG